MYQSTTLVFSLFGLALLAARSGLSAAHARGLVENLRVKDDVVLMTACASSLVACIVGAVGSFPG